MNDFFFFFLFIDNNDNNNFVTKSISPKIEKKEKCDFNIAYISVSRHFFSVNKLGVIFIAEKRAIILLLLLLKQEYSDHNDVVVVVVVVVAIDINKLYSGFFVEMIFDLFYFE